MSGQKPKHKPSFRQPKTAATSIKSKRPDQQAEQSAKDWGVGGGNSHALNAATTLITGTLGGQTNLQVAANTLAPYAAASIGRTVGHRENKNEAAQAVGHFILGATLAYVNGADPLAGGSATLAAEKTAQYLSAQYNDGKTAIDPNTGEFNPNLLPEPIKAEIRSVTGAIASVVGATGDGGAAFNAQVAGVIGQNAVENNELLYRIPKLSSPVQQFADKEFQELLIKLHNKTLTREETVQLIEKRNQLLWNKDLTEGDRNLLTRTFFASMGSVHAAGLISQDELMNMPGTAEAGIGAQMFGGARPSAGRGKVDTTLPRTRGNRTSVNLESIDKLMSRANKSINNQGIIQAARAWAKHSGRPGGTFKPLKGNIEQQNQYAANWIESVLKNPQTIKTNLSKGGVSYRLPNGQGVAFEADGRVNLLDPSKNIRSIK